MINEIQNSEFVKGLKFAKDDLENLLKIEESKKSKSIEKIKKFKLKLSQLNKILEELK